MKILANDGISQSGIDALTAKGFDVITNNVPQESLIEYINQNSIAAILVRSATKVRKDIVDSCPSIKLIGRGGVGMDNIDVEYAREKGLEVINTPAASSQSVAELVMAHLFSISRFTFDSNREMPTKGANEFKVLKKKYAKGVELRGKTIGIIGFGRIGQSLAKYALGCGMNVLAYDKFDYNNTVKLELANGISIDIEVTKATFNELLANSDYISLHVPMQSDGSAVIGKTEIELMKTGVRIVNAARGGVINEDALIEGLNSGKIAYTALDVFESEPTPRKDLLSNNKIAFTPHIGAATSEAQDRIGLELANKIITYFN
jgi:D-3-phosphoglycerate dehydrogenase